MLDENDRLKERLRAFRQTQATARHSGTDSETERLADNLLHLRGSDTEGAIAIDAVRASLIWCPPNLWQSSWKGGGTRAVVLGEG